MYILKLGVQVLTRQNCLTYIKYKKTPPPNMRCRCWRSYLPCQTDTKQQFQYLITPRNSQTNHSHKQPRD